jgi:hypothetical protein
MFYFDKDRLHLYMGLTHPVMGPMNLAVYASVLWASTGYAMYTASIKALLDATSPPQGYGEKPRNPT